MNRIVLICLLILLPLCVFADGKVNGIDGAVSITSSQNGSISVVSGDNSVVLSVAQRDLFIDVLKKHSDFLNTLTTQKISIKSTRYTGTFKASATDSFGFWVYVNNYKDQVGAIGLDFNNGKTVVTFDSASLNAFIKELENTKGMADNQAAQAKMVDDLIEKLKVTMRG